MKTDTTTLVVHGSDTLQETSLPQIQHTLAGKGLPGFYFFGMNSHKSTRIVCKLQVHEMQFLKPTRMPKIRSLKQFYCHCPSTITARHFAATPAGPAQAHASPRTANWSSRFVTEGRVSRVGKSQNHGSWQNPHMCIFDFVNLRSEFSLAEVKTLKVERQKATRK